MSSRLTGFYAKFGSSARPKTSHFSAATSVYERKFHLTNVPVIAVSASIAGAESCQIELPDIVLYNQTSFSTKQVKRPISPRLWISKPGLHLLKSDLETWTSIRGRRKEANANGRTPVTIRVHSRSVETETKKSCKARPWRVPYRGQYP